MIDETLPTIHPNYDQLQYELVTTEKQVKANTIKIGLVSAKGYFFSLWYKFAHLIPLILNSSFAWKTGPAMS